MSTRLSTLQLLSIFLLLPSLISTQVEVTFSPYPTASQPCLNNAAYSSGCPLEGTLYAINSCLCSNGGNFASNAAACVGSDDPADLQEVWNVMVGACDATDTPVTFTESEFFAAAGKESTTPTTMITTRRTTSTSATAVNGQVTTTESQTTKSTTLAASSAPSSSSSNSNSNNNGDSVGHLSGGMIALIGSVAGVGCLVIALLTWCGCARRARYGR